jgi:hypothetical protein
MASRAPLQTPPGSLKVFVADGDSNSKRIIETIKSIPSLHPVTSVVDVSTTPYRGIDAVPTLLVDGRRKLVGTQAFEYLRGFEQELKDPVGACSLGFSMIDGAHGGDVSSSWYGAY